MNNNIKKELFIYNNAIEKEKIWRKENVEDSKVLDLLINDINKNGYNFKYKADLIYRNIIDKDLIPVVSKYLNKFNNKGISAELIVLISHKGFYESTKIILEQLEDIISRKNKLENYLINAYDNALYEIKDKRYIDDYVELISDKENATLLPLVLILLSEWEEERTKEILLQYVSEFLEFNDSQLIYNVINCLGNYKDLRIIPCLENVLNSKNKLYIKYANSSIKKIKNKK